MRRGSFNQSGFTFLEMILTTVVLSVGLWGGMALFHNATLHSLDNDSRVIASELAGEKIESIVADKTFRGYGWIVGANYPAEVLVPPHQGFTRSVTITEVNPNDLTTPMAGSGYKKIDVQVGWGNQGFQSVVVSTLLTDYT